MHSRGLSRREFLRLSALTAASAMLAACSATPEPNAEPAVVESEPEATAAPPEATEGAKVEIWNIWGGTREPLMQDMFSRFNEAHPGIEAVNVLVPGAEYLTKLQTSIAAGTPPGVAMLQQWWMPAMATRDSLMPIDGYLESEGVDSDSFYDYIWDLCQWNGVTYMLPNVAGVHPDFYVNVDHLAEAGFQPPETWDDLLNVSKELTVIEDGQLKRMGLNWWSGGMDDVNFFYLVRANGGKAMSDDATKFQLDAAEAVEAMQWVVDFTKEVYGNPAVLEEYMAMREGQEVSDPFMSGDASMAFHGGYIVFQLKDQNPDLNYAVPSVMPYNKEKVSVFRGNWGYGIPKGVEDPAASFQVLEWLTVEESAACWFVREQLRPSPVAVCNDDSAYGDAGGELWEGIKAQNAVGEAVPITPVHQEAMDVLNRELELMFFWEKTPEQALATAQEECQRLLDNYFTDL